MILTDICKKAFFKWLEETHYKEYHFNWEQKTTQNNFIQDFFLANNMEVNFKIRETFYAVFNGEDLGKADDKDSAMDMAIEYANDLFNKIVNDESFNRFDKVKLN